MLARRMVEKLGHRAKSSPRPEALDAIGKAISTCVDGLSDAVMTAMSDVGAAQTRGQGRHLPVVAMTANAVEGDRERCVEAGMDDYIAKRCARRSRRDHRALVAAAPAKTAVTSDAKH